LAAIPGGEWKTGLLDDALGWTEMAIERLADARTGRNGRLNQKISTRVQSEGRRPIHAAAN
jgi:hypothetical protein